MDQAKIDAIHSELMDVFAALLSIRPADYNSRDARQKAVEAVLKARKNLDGAGLVHSIKRGVETPA